MSKSNSVSNQECLQKSDVTLSSSQCTPGKTIEPSTECRSASNQSTPAKRPVPHPESKQYTASKIDGSSAVSNLSFGHSTPVKKPAPNPAPSRYTPVKTGFSSAVSSPASNQSTPVKKASGLECLRLNIDSFTEQMDTQIRASLYSYSVGDTKDIKNTLESMRHALKDFQSQAHSSLKMARLRNASDNQKIASLQQQSSNLSMENKTLQHKVQSLQKKQVDMVVKEQIQDESMFDEDFEDTEEPPMKKANTNDG